jgi:hypothetical protein
MAGEKIIQLPTGSPNDNSLGIVADPITGQLFQTGYKSLKNYFLSGVTIDTGSLASTASLNAVSSSIHLDFTSYTSSNDARVSNVFASHSNYLPTASYLPDSSSFDTRIKTLSGSLSSLTGSYATTGAFNTYTASANLQIANTYASASNYLPTSSYLTDSSSFDTRIKTLSGSLSSLTGSYVATGTFNSYTASTAIQVSNNFASQSNYLPTSSYLAFSASYSSDSASFNSRINNFTGSSGGASDSLQIYTTGSICQISNSINIVYVDPASLVSALLITLPATGSTNNNIDFFFGGNVVTGTVIQNLSFTGSLGQRILSYSTSSIVNAGESIGFKYRSANSTWYRKY